MQKVTDIKTSRVRPRQVSSSFGENIDMCFREEGDFAHCICTAMGSKRKERYASSYLCIFFPFYTDKQLSVFKPADHPVRFSVDKQSLLE